MIETAKQLRDTNAYTCVALGHHTTFTSHDKGVMPLYGLNKTSSAIGCYDVLADKIIGKAAAILAIRLGIQVIDTLLISSEGKALLEHYGICYTYEKEVPFIANRFHTDQCPMEKSLDHVSDIEEGWQIIDTFILNRENRRNKS